jgi:two-component system aerobic respiration control sensor histidine kinase ArcB
VENDLIHQLQTTVEFLEAENFRLKSVIEHLPGSIYWKDKEGVYLGRNTFSLEKMQSVELERGSTVKGDVIGKTDYDLFSKEVADRYREHDLTVMRTQKEPYVN